MLKDFMRDMITLKKQDGRVFENIKAQVDPKNVFTDDVSIPFEEGDCISRTLPNGIEETYIIVQAHFYDKFHGIPANYQIDVRKASRQEHNRFTTINNYSVSGTNSRINIGSTDVSYNSVESMDEEELFSSLLTVINKQLDNNQEMIASVTDLKGSIGTKSYGEKYNSFIQSVANHITIFAPFIPALSSLLIK